MSNLLRVLVPVILALVVGGLILLVLSGLFFWAADGSRKAAKDSFRLVFVTSSGEITAYQSEDQTEVWLMAAAALSFAGGVSIIGSGSGNFGHCCVSSTGVESGD